jgi:hypothetical protein
VGKGALMWGFHMTVGLLSLSSQSMGCHFANDRYRCSDLFGGALTTHFRERFATAPLSPIATDVVLGINGVKPSKCPANKVYA